MSQIELIVLDAGTDHTFTGSLDLLNQVHLPSALKVILFSFFFRAILEWTLPNSHMLQLMCKGCLYTYPPLSIARCPFIQLSELEQCRVKKLAQGFNTAAQDLNPGLLSREFEALPRSHCALQSLHKLSSLVRNRIHCRDHSYCSMWQSTASASRAAAARPCCRHQPASSTWPTVTTRPPSSWSPRWRRNQWTWSHSMSTRRRWGRDRWPNDPGGVVVKCLHSLV